MGSAGDFMKKTGLLFLVFLLGGCWNAGNLNIFPERNLLLEDLQTYPIKYYNHEPILVRSEYVNEKSVETNEVLTAFKGYSVVSDKTYQVDYYEDYMVKANVNGMLNSASVPDRISANKPMRVIGEVNIDGVIYRLLPSSLKGFVFMVKPDGSFYDEMGQIRHNRLAILEATFVPSPENLRIIPVKNSKSTQTRPVKGYDLKFDGVKLNRVLFTFLDYSLSPDGESGAFENVSFPLGQANVNINGIRLRIIHADNQKLDYVVLQY